MDSKTLRSRGKVYTPPQIVDTMLDLADYSGDRILNLRVMENSCGEGAFILKMAERYCEEYHRKHGKFEGFAKEFSRYIHGIDIDKEAIRRCREALDDFVAK